MGREREREKKAEQALSSDSPRPSQTFPWYLHAPLAPLFISKNTVLGWHLWTGELELRIYAPIKQSMALGAKKDVMHPEIPSS